MALRPPQMGMLNRRAVLQRLTGDTRNSVGEPVEQWDTVETVWAYVQPQAVGSGEIDEATESKAITAHIVWIRYRSNLLAYNGGLTPRWRLRLGERYLNITVCLDWEEKHLWHYLECIEESLPVAPTSDPPTGAGWEVNY